MSADRTGGTEPTGGNGGPGKQGRDKLSRRYGWLAVLGVVLVLAGLVGLVYVGLATLTTMFLFGWLLLIGGAVGLLQAFQSRRTNSFWLAVIIAAINIAAGLVILARPEASAEALTMFAALFFLIGGLFRLAGAVVVRGPDLGLTLAQGAFGVLLGLLILWEWPGSSLYVVGAFFSLALLFDGLALVTLGIGARRILGLVSEAETAPAGSAGDGRATAAGAGMRPTEDQDRSNN
ncbi:DUF308 domain-containing protein [Streptomyces sp. NPDC089799]|uniref:HdeD family acid-resistance protein n=1 Tax=Streptomyces sp. NPDC089799 TaxID=3155066 RepID=UPI00342DC827